MPIDQQRLHRTLNPSSIVVVGDKGPNYGWLQRQKHFSGPVYSVQLDPVEVAAIEALGYTNFKSLDEVPGDIDLLICAVPRQVVPRIVSDAVKRGVGGIAMYTSGFAETGEPEFAEMQKRIVEMATGAGMALVGPNCLGIYNRRTGVRFGDDQEFGEGGTISIAGQSGTNTGGILSGLQRLGAKVTRAISFGNAAVLNECDYLEYFMNDPLTEVVVMYIEGVRDGRRFFDLARRTALKKPVVVWKGGQTVAGARAVQSHTASLASQNSVWDALLKQANIIGTGTMEETLDVAGVLANVKQPTGRGVALIGMNGGQAVALSDQFSIAGFQVPQLSDASYAQLAEFFMVVGGSYRNPFDAASTIRREDDNLAKILEILAQDAAIDGGVGLELGARDLDTGGEELNRILELLDGFRQKTGQPVVCLMHEQGGGEGGAEAMVRARKYVGEKGFAVAPSYARGAAALGRVVSYYEERARRS